MDKRKTPVPADVLKQVIPPLTAWAVNKILDRPRVKAALIRVDRATSVRARRARQVTIRNRALLAAGAAVLLIGAGLIANASRKSK